MATASGSSEVSLNSCAMMCQTRHMPLQDPTLGVIDSFRRTWDKEKYEKMAKERTKKDSGKFPYVTLIH